MATFSIVDDDDGITLRRDHGCGLYEEFRLTASEATRIFYYLQQLLCAES